MQTYIARIEQVNETVNAISQINPDAVDDAIQLDKERSSGHIRGWVTFSGSKYSSYPILWTSCLICLCIRHLHGIPVLLKDTIGTLDKSETTGKEIGSQNSLLFNSLTNPAGSLALVGARPSAEAGVVKRLRNSGAIILGKTTITQWGNTRSVRAPNGWSSTNGQCYAPFYAKQDPNGSSSGCAVAAAMGLAAATIGGEVCSTYYIFSSLLDHLD